MPVALSRPWVGMHGVLPDPADRQPWLVDAMDAAAAVAAYRIARPAAMGAGAPGDAALAADDAATRPLPPSTLLR